MRRRADVELDRVCCLYVAANRRGIRRRRRDGRCGRYRQVRYKMVFANVDHVSVSSLAAWENFYVIVGSSAAALTGLQFVVMALVAETRRPSSRETIDAFGTPTILHFAFVLLLASIVAAPWPTLSSAAIAISACGLVGVVYVCIVILWTRRYPGHVQAVGDWILHIVLVSDADAPPATAAHASYGA